MEISGWGIRGLEALVSLFDCRVATDSLRLGVTPNFLAIKPQKLMLNCRIWGYPSPFWDPQAPKLEVRWPGEPDEGNMQILLWF